MVRAASRPTLVSIPNSYRASLDRHPHIVLSPFFFCLFSSFFCCRPSLPSSDSSGFPSRCLDTSFHSLPCRVSSHHPFSSSSHRIDCTSIILFFSPPFTFFTSAGSIHPVVARPSVCLDPGREGIREERKITGKEEGRWTTSTIPHPG